MTPVLTANITATNKTLFLTSLLMINNISF